ncbi:hypothetical protein Pla110_18730 [Polystyrenella longa]|uniref:Uncharacterized protein n=1 Tax=Polystyrenella longa TaxID=2528007 RepID=A0A518CLP7_9PLAN|nr:hypothetical protein [Polystyrenella longa]QDU80150.1 hypothetical protein Pla110_18730 [Polystyrenella longa]
MTASPCGRRRWKGHVFSLEIAEVDQLQELAAGLPFDHASDLILIVGLIGLTCLQAVQKQLLPLTQRDLQHRFGGRE